MARLLNSSDRIYKDTYSHVIPASKILAITTGTIYFSATQTTTPTTFTFSNLNIPISNIQNTPYLATFATELQINDLIFVPTFQIVTAKITPLNDANPPEVSLTQLNSVKLTWSEIKPEDKTPEGSLYQTYKNLFNSAFETIQNDETGKTIRYCAGVILTPYYGKSS